MAIKRGTRDKVLKKLAELFAKRVAEYNKTGKIIEFEERSIKMASKELNIKPQDLYMEYGKFTEKKGKRIEAGLIYANLYDKYGTEEAYSKALKCAERADKEGLIHSAEKIYSIIGLRPQTKGKYIDNVVTSLIALGGIGLFFTLFPASKLAAIQTGQQLAPPLQDYTIYIFLALLLGGLIYLAVRKFRRRISIPLSF